MANRPPVIVMPNMYTNQTESRRPGPASIIQALAAAWSLYDASIGESKRRAASEASAVEMGKQMGMDRQSGATLTEGMPGYTVKEQPGVDLGTLAKSDFGREAISTKWKSQNAAPKEWQWLAQMLATNPEQAKKYQDLRHPMTESQQGAKIYQTQGLDAYKDYKGSQKSGRDYTQTKTLLFDKKFAEQHGVEGSPDGQFHVWGWDTNKKDYSKDMGVAQPNWAVMQDVSDADIRQMVEKTYSGSMNYSQAKYALSRTAKGEARFVTMMGRLHPDFNFQKSEAQGLYFRNVQNQDRIKFGRTILGDQETGNPGTLEYVKQLSHAFERSDMPILNRAIIKGYKDFAGDKTVAAFLAGLYNLAVESRQAVSRGNAVHQSSIDQEIDRLAAAYNEGQLDSVMDVLHDEILMRQSEILKGTPEDMGDISELLAKPKDWSDWNFEKWVKDHPVKGESKASPSKPKSETKKPSTGGPIHYDAQGNRVEAP